jgi:CspA family cold shock protein
LICITPGQATVNSVIAILFKEDVSLAKGVIKWFSDERGYGFIQQEEGEDVFVHFSSIIMPGFKSLAEGDEVSFDLETNERGLVAKNVSKI